MSGEVIGKKVDCLKRHPCAPGTVLLKDEELAWYLTHGGQ